MSKIKKKIIGKNLEMLNMTVELTLYMLTNDIDHMV